jgi:hypothetical protein
MRLLLGCGLTCMVFREKTWEPSDTGWLVEETGRSSLGW